MALGSTQSPREMSTRNISKGKGGRCVGLRIELYLYSLFGHFVACYRVTFTFNCIYYNGAQSG
jgi:hypothetical protein